jgi:hypothetical protein
MSAAAKCSFGAATIHPYPALGLGCRKRTAHAFLATSGSRGSPATLAPGPEGEFFEYRKIARLDPPWWWFFPVVDALAQEEPGGGAGAGMGRVDAREAGSVE